MGAVPGPTKKLGSWARRVFRMPQSRSLRDVPDDCDRRNNEGYAKRASQSGENKTRIHHTPIELIESPITAALLSGVNPLSFARN